MHHEQARRRSRDRPRGSCPSGRIKPYQGAEDERSVHANKD
jgi:hypothetical protein